MTLKYWCSGFDYCRWCLLEPQTSIITAYTSLFHRTSTSTSTLP
ncbi:unnamed protein product [Ixodes pacificus]